MEVTQCLPLYRKGLVIGVARVPVRVLDASEDSQVQEWIAAHPESHRLTPRLNRRTNLLEF